MALAGGYFVGRLTPAPVVSPDAPPTLPDGAKPQLKAAANTSPLDAGHASVDQGTLTPAPLPPAGTPIAQNQIELAQRARSGDAAAAMRLFGDLQNCNARAEKMLMLNAIDSPQAADDLGKPALLAAKNNYLGQLEATDRLCAGTTADELNRRGEWLRVAALDGDSEAMVCYAASPEEFGPRFLSDAWFDWIERWRAEAPEFVARAFARGQTDLIALLYDAYGNERMPSGERYTLSSYARLVAPDPVLEYGYALLYERAAAAGFLTIAHRRVIAAQAALSADEIARAQTFAESTWPLFQAQVGNGIGIFPCKKYLATP